MTDPVNADKKICLYYGIARELQSHKISGLFSALLKSIKMTRLYLLKKRKKKERNKTFQSKNFISKFNLKSCFMTTL